MKTLDCRVRKLCFLSRNDDEGDVIARSTECDEAIQKSVAVISTFHSSLSTLPLKRETEKWQVKLALKKW
jgi:Ni,Fe-hydrogenase III large subunit